MYRVIGSVSRLTLLSAFFLHRMPLLVMELPNPGAGR